MDAVEIIRVGKGKTMFEALKHYKVMNRCGTCRKNLMRTSKHVECEENRGVREKLLRAMHVERWDDESTMEGLLRKYTRIVRYEGKGSQRYWD